MEKTVDVPITEMSNELSQNIDISSPERTYVIFGYFARHDIHFGACAVSSPAKFRLRRNDVYIATV